MKNLKCACKTLYPPTICLLIQNAKVETEHNSDQNLTRSCTPWLQTACKISWALHKIFIGLRLKRGITPSWRLWQKRKNKLMTAITQEVSGSIYSNVNQVIYFSLTIYLLGFKALASIVFEILCWQDFIHIFSMKSGKGHNPDKKKKCVHYFFMRNPYVKFQNPSMHSSKVMLCIKVCNVKMPKMTKGHNSRSTFQNFIQKLIRSSTNCYQSIPNISMLLLQ